MVKTNNKLLDYEKARVVESYAKGIHPSLIAKVLGRKVSTITSFFSRFRINRGLEPKHKRSKSLINGNMGLNIKKLVLEFPKFGVRRIAVMLQKRLPGLDWYPGYSAIYDFLKRNSNL